MAEFPMVPATSRYLWFLIPVVAVVALAMGMLAVTIIGSRSARFEVGAEGLRLRGDLYGRLIPRSELRLEAARRVNLASERELQPTRRTFGTGLPGYQAGWFRLRSGEKALLYLTDRSRAVYIPTTAGYSILLSPVDPEAFLGELRGTRGS